MKRLHKAYRRRLRGALDSWEKIAWSLRLGWSVSRLYVLMLCGLTLIQGILPAMAALAGRNLLNSVSAIMMDAGGERQSVYFWLIAGFTLAMALIMTTNFQKYIRGRFQDDMNVRLSRQLLAHAASLDYASFEDPEHQDLIAKVKDNTSGSGITLLGLLLSITTGLVQATSLVALLIYIEPLVTPLILMVSIPYFVFRIRFVRRRTEEQLARAQKRRWSGYYSSHLISPDRAAETRMLNLGPVFLEQHGAIQEEFRARNIQYSRFDLIGTSVFVTASLVAVYVAFARAAIGAIERGLTIGDVAIFGATATQLRGIIQRTVDQIGTLREQVIHTAVLMDFLALEPKAMAGNRELPESLRGEILLHEVTFSYPGASKPALESITLSIEPGETVALVGRNGSGKTTLAKLLARLYDVDSGRIEIDGIDLRDIDPNSMHRHMSCVFQNFGRFEATAAENIAYGDWEALLHQQSAIQSIAKYTGIDEVIEALPNGYDTRLGRLFGETTLSGGQWQQIAITRALARNTPIIVLDEPTANLDVHAEYELYELLRRLAEGRTVLLISHRFSTVRMADRIIVLDKGRIVEQGPHDDLLQRNGPYATLYRLFERQMVHGK